MISTISLVNTSHSYKKNFLLMRTFVLFVCFLLARVERRGIEKDKHPLVASQKYPSWGLNLQPGYVPWHGIKSATLLYTRQRVRATQPGLMMGTFKISFNFKIYYSIINYSCHAVLYIPKTFILYWKFVHFEHLHPFCPPLTWRDTLEFGKLDLFSIGCIDKNV